MKNFFRCFVVGFLVFISPSGFADPKVIEAQPWPMPTCETVNPVTGEITIDVCPINSKPYILEEEPMPLTPEELEQAIRDNYYPVVSKKLAPGKVESEVHKFTTLLRPIFLVGADQASVQWLQMRRPHLEKIGAIGLVVNVETPEQFVILKRAAGDKLSLQAGTADGLVENFNQSQGVNLRNYPVLITSTSLEQ